MEEEDSAVTVMGGRIDCGGEEEKAEGREKRKRGKVGHIYRLLLQYGASEALIKVFLVVRV